MRALVLEDDELRARALKRLLTGRGFLVVHVSTFAAAVGELETAPDPFTFATLDFDLRAPQTGLDVAEYIARMSPSRRPARVEVHSGDDRGAAMMLAVLQGVGVAAERGRYA